jgi:hypothetical protein
MSHNAEEYLDAYLDAAGLWDEKKAPLFQSIRHGKATGNKLAQADVYRIIRRRALAVGFGVDVCCHTWRATGITAYLLNGGALETQITNRRARLSSMTGPVTKSRWMRLRGSGFSLSRICHSDQLEGSRIATSRQIGGQQIEFRKTNLVNLLQQAVMPSLKKGIMKDDMLSKTQAIQKLQRQIAEIDPLLHIRRGSPEFTRWHRNTEVAEVLEPIYERMKKEAAQGKVFHVDDTPVKIMELIKENQERKKKKEEEKEREKGKEKKRKKTEEERVSIQTSGVVVKLCSGAKVVLYFNGRQHAGENVEGLYQLRDPGLGLPMQMSDALACNWCGEMERIVCKCLAHARRKFVEIRSTYPESFDYVLEQIGKVYRNERAMVGSSDEERLAYHQEQSGPEMTELKQWMDEQKTKKKVEPNSRLGQAIEYFQDHYEGLTAYLRFAGAPIDNNLGEQVLRPVAIIRKNSYGYKTSRGRGPARS